MCIRTHLYMYICNHTGYKIFEPSESKNDKLDNSGRMCVTNDNSLRVNANQFQFHRVFTDYYRFYCWDNVSTNSRRLATTLFHVCYVSFFICYFYQRLPRIFKFLNLRDMPSNSRMCTKRVKHRGTADGQNSKDEQWGGRIIAYIAN